MSNQDQESQEPLINNDVDMEQEPQLSPEEIAAREAKAIRDEAVLKLKKRIIDHQRQDEKLKNLRKEIKTLEKNFDKTEYDIKALQSIGQLIGEVMKELSPEKVHSQGKYRA
ncbi:unnamed protein product [Hanseniaspora opuntiae]